MSIFTIKIADIPVQINSVHDEIKYLCQDFLTDDNPLFSIISSKEEIIFEKKHRNNNWVSCYTDSIIEFQSIHRRLSDELAEYDTILMHGSSISMNGEGYLFVADSGTGKSTHARNWMQHFKGDVVSINDDKPYIRKIDGDYFIYGSPWNGKERVGNNIVAPLRYIIILDRSDTTVINEISAESAYIHLLRHTYFPSSETLAKVVVNLLPEVSCVARMFHLRCTADEDSAMIAYRGIHHIGY